MAKFDINNLITGTTLYYYTHTIGKVEFGSFIIDRIDFFYDDEVVKIYDTKGREYFASLEISSDYFKDIKKVRTYIYETIEELDKEMDLGLGSNK